MPTRSDILRAKRKAVGGRRPRCRRGKSCSAACINRNKYCLVDAPTPVAGALPRAVRAIQSRRERLKPREKREVLQKRREYVKGKVKEGVEARKQKAERRRARAEEHIKKRMYELQMKMSYYSRQDKKGSYEKAEEKFMKLQEQLRRLGGQSSYQKGYLWKQSKNVRERDRYGRLSDVYNALVSQAKDAAKAGDRSRYDKAERSLLKIAARAGDRIGLRGKPTKGSLWKEERVPGVLEKLRKSMEDAISAGDLRGYNRLEEKFIKARDGFISGNPNRKNLLFTSYGPGLLAQRGEMLTRALSTLESDAYMAAVRRNRREYNTLEERLLKLKPGEEKGRIWKDRIQQRVREYVPRLKDEMIRAIRDGDRKRYNKLEKVFLKLEPSAQKGKLWRTIKTEDYLPTLVAKVKKAAEDGDRRRYNKLERVLLRIDPNNPSYNTKGKIWVRERIGGVLDKLKDEMEKAVTENDRDRYDRLEARLFRIRNKVGDIPYRFRDITYLSRGDIWSEVKGREALSSAEIALNKDRRPGVSKIKVTGKSDRFELTSSVLGNSLEILVVPNDSTSFRVNGSYTASDTLSRREQVAIIRESRRQYDEIFKSMPDGTVFAVTAAGGDARKEMRERGYTDRGFSAPDENGRMFGMVLNGRVVPIDEDEYYNAVNG